MPGSEVPLFGTGQKGKSPNVTAQERLNCFLEFVEDPDKTRIAVYGTPGFERSLYLGASSIRGVHEFPSSSVGFVVHGNQFIEVNNALQQTVRGTIFTSEGWVSIADNGSEVMIVDGQYGYIYDTVGHTLTQIVDVDFPTTPQTVAHSAGRFIVTDGSGQYYGSAILDGTSWDGLDFASAESDPDNIRIVEAIGSSIVLFGDTSVEVHGYTGSGGFPFALIPGAVIDEGIAAKRSVSKWQGTLVYLARKDSGEVQVSALDGYKSKRLSSYELESVINNYPSVSDATAFSYSVGGHEFYQINFTGGDTSWVLDSATGLWSKVKSWGMGRHRGDMKLTIANTSYISDHSSGKLLKINPNVYTDDSYPIEFEITSRHVFNSGNIIRVFRLQLDMESGAGNSGQGEDPRAMLSISKDNGHSWGTEIWTAIGKVGEYAKRVIWRRLGRGNDFTFKVRITDPVKRVITNGYMVVG